jgi:hypothetical protein
MQRWWISWVEPVDESEDYRPRNWPLPPSIPAYWCSGWDGGSRAAMLCAVVDAETPEQAMDEIRAYWNPREWRFCEPRDEGWRPQSDRFPWPEQQEKTPMPQEPLARREIYNAAREAYPDPDFFPENYDDPVKDEWKWDNLARFIAIEIWEVMEGQETLDGCRDEAIRALRNAQEDLQAVIDALEVY